MCELVRLVNRSRQLVVRAEWDPKPSEDDGNEPQPKRANSLTIRADAVPRVRERVNDGEDEGNNDPRH